MKKYIAKAVITPLNGGSGKIVKRFTDSETSEFMSLYRMFWSRGAWTEVPRRSSFAIGNGILNIQFYIY